MKRSESRILDIFCLEHRQGRRWYLDGKNGREGTGASLDRMFLIIVRANMYRAFPLCVAGLPSGAVDLGTIDVGGWRILCRAAVCTS